MSQSVDFRKTIYELVKENPAVAQVMQELGFKDITNPAMLNTAGRVMTIPKGASLKKIDLDTIKQVFQAKGFEVIE
ncbi:DUF1858 domain-containing protein [Desulforamulus ferrireducens]|uniref:DUF1858 domain-containing protein n=1 Tax=Desulforamulus ferrireducens TaxID=1833852 RepID=A0A1S6IVY6_9FIRM|nr:DUF1858 domain-containing protein [Desulforamulus ferrireducens]AQS58947.1 hypothetical protein B0537_07525 [Desulforamulus ferrireducens]